METALKFVGGAVASIAIHFLLLRNNKSEERIENGCPHPVDGPGIEQWEWHWGGRIWVHRWDQEREEQVWETADGGPKEWWTDPSGRSPREHALAWRR